MKELTIIIPTFNRRERLLRQLESLHAQGLFELYSLVILDNHSDYDIRKTIVEHGFSPYFTGNIEIVRRPVNTRMGYNLAGTLLYSKTKWVWLVSDDDVSTPDSIQTVLRYTRLYPDISQVKFQFTYCNEFEDKHVKSVDELEVLYNGRIFESGDLFYLGNNLINTEAMADYLGDAFEYSSNLIPFVMPMLHQLVDGKAEIVFSDKHVQKYVNNTSGDTWMSVHTILKFAQLYDINWGNDIDSHRIFDIISRHFNTPDVVRMLLSETDSQYRNYAYHRLRSTIFKRHMTLKEHLFWLFYRIENFTGLPLLQTFTKQGLRK